MITYVEDENESNVEDNEPDKIEREKREKEECPQTLHLAMLMKEEDGITDEYYDNYVEKAIDQQKIIERIFKKETENKDKK